MRRRDGRLTLCHVSTVDRWKWATDGCLMTWWERGHLPFPPRVNAAPNVYVPTGATTEASTPPRTEHRRSGDCRLSSPVQSCGAALHPVSNETGSLTGLNPRWRPLPLLSWTNFWGKSPSNLTLKKGVKRKEARGWDGDGVSAKCRSATAQSSFQSWREALPSLTRPDWQRGRLRFRLPVRPSPFSRCRC